MDGLKALSSSASLLLFLAMLCAFFREGLSITCYMCNSSPDRHLQACATLAGDKSLFVQNCEKLGDGKNYTVCRKLFQTIFANDGSEIERVIRQCGTQGPLDCTRQTRPNTLQVYACHCNTDLCNAAVTAHNRNPFYVVIASLVFSVVYSILLGFKNVNSLV